jgi:hypothetical protein
MKTKESNMVKKFFAATLALSLVLPEVLLAQQATTPVAAANPPAAATAAPPQSSGESQNPQSVRPQSTSQQHAYQREVRPHHRQRISKGEVVFMAGIAGTSMGIGALAGGATGLAIGAIVGGWGAYLGHRIWNWVK